MMAAGICAAGLAMFVPQSASAYSLVISGSALYNLTYVGNPGDAQYFSGIPPVAQLSTPDSSPSGDSPAVFVELESGITLSSLSVSYTLLSSNPGNVLPYFTLYMADDGSFSLPIVSTYGTPLNSSSLVHTGDLIHGSITLSALDATIDPNSGLPYGPESVAWVGLEIGDGGSGPANANIQSITIDASVPDSGSTGWLLAASFCVLVFFGNRYRTRSAIGI
jgi:hypothetical protein